MRILVTGSSGQVGSYVMDLGREQGHDMRGLDIRPDPRWTHVVGDIRDAASCASAMTGIDAVIHCAAHISVQHSIEDPAFDASTNVLGTLNLLEAARKTDARRFVNVSSAATYGNPRRLPIDEEHPLRPLSPYGAGKAAAEAYADMYSNLHGLQVVNARPFNIYSRRQDPTNPYSGVLAKFADAVRSGRAPIIFGDGNQTRDFIHATDVADALLAFATHVTARGTFNVASGNRVTILSMANRFLSLSRVKLKPEFRQARPGDIKDSSADVTRLRQFVSPPKMALEQGVADLLASGETESGFAPRRAQNSG